MPGVSIIRTLERGRKFKEERYISADSIYTYLSDELFCVKAKCMASMKKEFRNIEISSSRSNGLVISGKYTCPAGSSSYFNHVMALLLEIADYSLNELKVVPQEVSCTSKSCQWGIPSINQKSKEPVMNTNIQNVGSKKVINSTLYDPRINLTWFNSKERISKLTEGLGKKDKRIGFAHVVDVTRFGNKESAKFGDFPVGSTLSHQLLPIDYNFKILTNLNKNTTTTTTNAL